MKYFIFREKEEVLDDSSDNEKKNGRIKYTEVEFYIDDSRDTTYESEVVLHDRRNSYKLYNGDTAYIASSLK